MRLNSRNPIFIYALARLPCRDEGADPKLQTKASPLRQWASSVSIKNRFGISGCRLPTREQRVCNACTGLHFASATLAQVCIVEARLGRAGAEG
eukprot:CAMPEP_0172212236 /NCGR_PEP_ID=MMETSP1050-20130122/36879_1 /TAXON_ID=233186 /ORGANISM="Cryptomonas curvata, Strain CCAP979/52" /LENGTH=93 /DNA_ID=CAMNT_0012892843 /DNA_START=376 /DNA_END=654 /DNA_ORIENTATION=-